MKRSVFRFLTLLLLNSTVASAQWQWARTVEPSSNSGQEGLATCTDLSGNIFVTGGYTGTTVVFGADTLRTLGNPNGIYIAKYDASGNAIWARTTTGLGAAVGFAIAADRYGNVYATGYYYGTISFGSHTITAGDFDLFIVKYDPNGNALWALTGGSASGEDKGASICVDTLCNVYVTGYFGYGTATFGSFQLSNNSHPSNSDLLVMKCDSQGNVLWANGYSGYWDERGNGISSDLAGNIFVTGYFQDSTLVIGNITLYNTNSYNEAFIAKFNSNGNVLWAKKIGSSSHDVGMAVCADRSGNVYVAGTFALTISIGTYVLTSNSGSVDIFIAKYNPSGIELWAQSAGGTNIDEVYCLSTDLNKNVYMTGSYWVNTSITFGFFTLAPFPNLLDQMFIVKYSPTGHVLCASALSSGGDDQNSVSADQFGNAYVTGDFYANPFIVGSDSLIPDPGEDFFLAKYSCVDDDVNDFKNDQPEFKIYPNPNSGNFTIVSNSEIGEIEIYDLLGETIFTSPLTKDLTEVNLSDKATGIYFVKLTSDGNYSCKKIIIE